VQVGQTRIVNVGQLEMLLRERQRTWQVLLRRGPQVLRLQLSG
jgi:hypothetical protein